jgi:hypothetical protein
MRWHRPNLRSSLQSILTLGQPASQAASTPAFGIEDIRERMLTLLGDDADQPNVKRRIRYALDVQGLWYLRGDLMSVMAGRDGEAAARAKLTAINEMFENLLPQGLRSRPSPLSEQRDE